MPAWTPNILEFWLGGRCGDRNFWSSDGLRCDRCRLWRRGFLRRGRRFRRGGLRWRDVTFRRRRRVGLRGRHYFDLDRTAIEAEAQRPEHAAQLAPRAAAPRRAFL